MKKRSNPSAREPSAEIWLEIIGDILASGKLTVDLPDGSISHADWKALVEELLIISSFAQGLANGDLSTEMKAKGKLAGSLKALQANLRHLTWQVRQVAAGDLGQQVDFMGDLADAFNAMINRLRWAREELEASEERYQSIISASPDDITITNLNGMIEFVSPSGFAMYRASDLEDMVGRHIIDFIHPTDQEKARESLRLTLNGIRTGVTEFLARRLDGTSFYIDSKAEVIHGFDGQPIGIIHVIRNVDEQKKAQIAESEARLLAEALRDTAAALNSVLTLEEVFDVILHDVGRVVAYDAVEILLAASDGTARIARTAGYDTVIPGYQHPGGVFIIDRTPNLQMMAESKQPIVVENVEAFNWPVTSATGWVKSHLGVPILIKGKVAGFINLMSRATHYYTQEHALRLLTFTNLAAIAIEKANLFNQLNYLAQTDPLTGIANRRQLLDRGEEEISRSRRYRTPLSVLMLDIDHFKLVNDTFGHHLGDQVLIVIAVTCSKLLRNIDLIGRYGGEEFAILLPETNAAQAEIAAERLRKGILNETVTTHAGYIRVTVSIGIAELTPEDKSFMALLDRADQALYKAKQSGRNQVVVFDLPTRS